MSVIKKMTKEEFISQFRRNVKILGIKPGLNCYSVSVVHCIGNEVKLLNLYKKEHDYQGESINRKLRNIFYEFMWLRTGLKKFVPDVVAFESQFMGVSKETMRLLCESVGVMKAALMQSYDDEIDRFWEYTPAEVKMAATAKGDASQKAVIQAINDKFQIDTTYDEANSVSISLAHLLFNKYNVKYMLYVENTLPARRLLKTLKFKSRNGKMSTAHRRDVYNFIHEKGLVNYVNAMHEWGDYLEGKK